MKAKIFGKLKQEYKALGLGDEILMSCAESLAALGLVTDENIDAVVAAQRPHLDTLQKANDKRVQEALETARKKAEEEARKKAEEEKRKAEEDAKRKAEEEAKRKEEEEAKRKAEEDARRQAELNKPTPEPTPEPKPDPMPTPTPTPVSDPRIDALEAQLKKFLDDRKKDDDAHKKTIEALTASKNELETKLKALTDENEAAKAKAAKEARQAMIVAKAKELGVPDWRIEEGFILADDATDEAIAETLGKVANNISNNLLPASGANRFPMSDAEPTKEEIASLAASLIP